MSIPLRVLIVEDSEDDALLLIRDLRRAGYAVTHERLDTAAALRAALAQRPWDLVLADYSLPGFDALTALRILKESGRDLPFIIVSGIITEETAVAAMRAGAHDYIMKGILARLIPAVERELRDAAERAQRQQLEAQLQQAQKLEAIGRLAGGIAHDLNNLLLVIGGSSDLLLGMIDPADPRHGHVTEIAKASARGAALTRQLLAFSRHQILEPEILDLNAVVVDVDQMLRRVIGEDVELELRLDPASGRVRADPHQVQQVIVNLAVNARDAMPRGGTLTLATATVDLDGDPTREYAPVPPGRYVRLTVRDTGCGMDPETRAHIFEPFFTTKEPGRGTGLGLATVYGIVKQSGGYIHVVSSAGAGSTFEVYLPHMAQVIEPLPPRAPSPESLRGTEVILLVEDDEQVRSLVRGILQAHGYTVLEATRADDALQLSERHDGPIDLLLTDLIMPGISGHELAQRLNVHRPRARVLYMTGYTDEAVLRHGVDAGLLVLQKPFTATTLARRVRAVLDTPGPS
jgi:signal transduction histidine kinase